MRFYTSQYRFYGGGDLHARTMSTQASPSRMGPGAGPRKAVWCRAASAGGHRAVNHPGAA
jgi:hypothetical protein